MNTYRVRNASNQTVGIITTDSRATAGLIAGYIYAEPVTVVESESVFALRA